MSSAETAVAKQKYYLPNWASIDVRTPEGLIKACQDLRQRLRLDCPDNNMTLSSAPGILRYFWDEMAAMGGLVPNAPPCLNVSPLAVVAQVVKKQPIADLVSRVDALDAINLVVGWCEKAKGTPPAKPPGAERSEGADAARDQGGTGQGKRAEAAKGKKKRGGKPSLKESDALFKLYERIRQVHRPGKRYSDAVDRLKAEKDFLELVKEAGVKLDTKLVRRAIAFFDQRQKAEARKKQETAPA
jgi:hypothetical protein